MKLQHLNLPVTNVSENKSFFETYFGFQVLEEINSTKMVALLDANDLVLLLDRVDEVIYPPSFHPGFTVESKEKLDGIYQHLKNGGVTVKSPEKFMQGWTFYAKAPGGFTVQVSC